MPLSCKSAVLKAYSTPLAGACPVTVRSVLAVTDALAGPRPGEGEGGRPEPAAAALRQEQAAREAEAIVARAREEAGVLREQARAAGWAEGRQAGLAAARQETEDLLDRAKHLLEQAAEERAAILTALEAEIRDLALDMAAALYQDQLSLDGDHVVRLAREAVSRACQGEKFTLRASSQDLAKLVEVELNLARRLPAGATLTFQGEDLLQPGGVVLENENGLVDASLEGRLALLREALNGGEPSVPGWLVGVPGRVS